MSPERPSKCMDESRRAQAARIAALTVRERMLLALELGERGRFFHDRFGARPERAP